LKMPTLVMLPKSIQPPSAEPLLLVMLCALAS
jgi:hypothetical protein